MRRFVGIYNAENGLSGELRYVLGKLTSDKSKKCELCEITHGLNPFGKPSWKKELSNTTVDFHLLHKNEATKQTSKQPRNRATNQQIEATSWLPSILEFSDHAWIEVFDARAIAEMNGSPFQLFQAIRGC